MPELETVTNVDDLNILATPSAADYVLITRNGEIYRAQAGDLPDGGGSTQSAFETVADFETWIAGGGTAANGTYAFANGAAFYADDAYTALPDKPGWRIAGRATLAHFDVNGTDIGAGLYYHATPASDEYAAIQAAFNFCVANGYDLVGDATRVYGTATELNWGSTATVTPKGSAELDNCSLMWIGAADTAIAKTDQNPDNWPWTTNTPVLRVGNRAGDTDKYRVTLGPGVRVDGQRIKNCIQFRGLEDVDASALAVRGLDYEVLIGVPGNNSAATTDCKIKVRGWHYAYLENSSGVFGTDDGTGHYGPTGRTSSGVVVYSSDVFVEPHFARGAPCAVLGEGYGATIAPVSKLYSGPDRTSGINAFLITPGAQRYTWLGADVQDGGIRVMSGNGKIIGLTLAQYTHNMITLVASAENETFEQFTLANCRFGGGDAAVTLETIGAGTWGSFAGTFYGNKNGSGEDMTIQGRKFNIGGTVDPFLSRADLVTAIGTYGWAPEVGTTVRIGALVWEYDGVSSGISDMPGWKAAGSGQPGHYTVNTTPGTTDMESALEAAMADGNVTLPPEEFLISNQLSTQSNIRIRGEKGAQITKAAGAAVGPVYVLEAEQNFTVSRVDFDIAADVAATNGVYLVPWASSLSDYELDHVEATANITVDPSTGARNGLAGVVLVSNGATVDGFRIKDCHFENFFYGFLQSNSTSAAVTDLTIADTTFKDFGAPALLFNSPAAGSYNKRIMVNRVLLGANKTKYGTLGPGTGRGYPHRASFAGHNHYFLWTDVIAFGDGGEALRMEEDARGWVVSNMAAELNGQDGFEAIPNHAGDAVTVYRPTLGLFSGVALDNTGLTTASALGAGLKLWVYDSVSGLEDAETVGESVFTNWAVSGWAYGADLHQGAHRDFINNGIIVGTTSGDVGLRTKDPSHAHSHVMIFDCDTAVEFDRGGNIGKMFFRSKSGMPDPAEISVTGGVGIMDGWDWHAPRATYANGVTYQNIISIGDEVEGRLSLSIQDDDGTNCAEISGHLRWDGTNMDFRPDQSGGTAAGNISFTAGGPVGVQGTYLAVSITNSSGGDLDNLRLQVSLDGESSHKWS
ncbi:hypothetical protein ACSSNL_18100 [Thalassobius sp. S69A]|uniref:hypothetical protein n=1 Tax=unclassified Thalassovita TaxID=2619711 RepID=UPI003C7EC270